MSEIMLVPSIINLKISISASNQKISLYNVATCKNIKDKVSIFYKYKNKYSFYATQKFAYIKADIQCEVACYGEGDNYHIIYPNLDILYLYLQKSL